MSHGPHNARIGTYAFYQRDDVLFGLESGETGTALTQTQTPTGHMEVIFAEDQFAVTDWLTLNGGVRVTYFSGALSENAVTPRVVVAVRVPRVEWAVRAYYGRYYQPPPLTTVSGPVLELAAEEGVGFLTLKGERDEQYEFGVAIPVRGWAVDVDYFHTNADNFFDHEPIDNSNIFIPVTIDMARIRGWEATVRAPRRQHTQAHLAYSHQFVEGRGGVSGGSRILRPQVTISASLITINATRSRAVWTSNCHDEHGRLARSASALGSSKVTAPITSLRIQCSICRRASHSGHGGRWSPPSTSPIHTFFLMRATPSEAPISIVRAKCRRASGIDSVTESNH